MVLEECLLIVLHISYSSTVYFSYLIAPTVLRNQPEFAIVSSVLFRNLHRKFLTGQDKTENFHWTYFSAAIYMYISMF